MRLSEIVFYIALCLTMFIFGYIQGIFIFSEFAKSLKKKLKTFFTVQQLMKSTDEDNKN